MKKFILLLSLILAGSCQAQFVINGTVSASSTITWVTLTNPPTTLAGYGITNAAALPVMTLNTNATVTFNAASNSETIFNTNAATLTAATITLSTNSVVGQTEQYVTAVTMAGGTIDVGATLTTLAANASVAWRCDVAGHWIRIQ